jgi:hypothetical protein
MTRFRAFGAGRWEELTRVILRRGQSGRSPDKESRNSSECCRSRLYRPLWDIVVISLMLGGTALCVTSLMLAWRVLARKLARIWEWLRPPNEDLAIER